MSLVNLSLHSFFNNDTYGEDRFVRLSQYLERRLRAAGHALADIGLHFEGDEATALAREFGKAADKNVGAEDFADLWNELEDWAGSRAYYNGREKTLCRLQHLPDRFAC